MKKKYSTILIISIILLLGVVLIAPNNLIDQQIMKQALNKEGIFYSVFYYLTFLGSRTILIPFVIIGSLYLYYKTKKISYSLIFMSGTLLSYVLNEFIKSIIKRERPSIVEQVHAVGYSFPSGHAMISTVCYGIFTYFLLKTITKKKYKNLIILLTGLLIVLIGYSRLALNVHYLTDVIGGYLIGALFIIVYLEIAKRMINN
ncbi:MAG TPA: phosphatase PAP2 family protein [Pseudogracilibacillus sp.]|nr:phosphatase PAP2 family protein [Pseudogracilibacillus sp.]